MFAVSEILSGGRGIPGALPALSPFQLIFGMEWIVFILLIFLIPLILFILVAVWVYQDANSRGMGGGLWVALLVLASLFGSFIGGIIVLVIYLLVRESHPIGGRPYGYGGYPGYPGYQGYGYPYGYPPGYPPQAPPPAPPAPPAGPSAAAVPGRCPRCGAPTHPGARFCASCGSPL